MEYPHVQSEIHLQSGSIFQPAMLIVRSVNYSCFVVFVSMDGWKKRGFIPSIHPYHPSSLCHGSTLLAKGMASNHNQKHAKLNHPFFALRCWNILNSFIKPQKQAKQCGWRQFLLMFDFFAYHTTAICTVVIHSCYSHALFIADDRWPDIGNIFCSSCKPLYSKNNHIWSNIPYCISISTIISHNSINSSTLCLISYDWIPKFCLCARSQLS